MTVARKQWMEAQRTPSGELLVYGIAADGESFSFPIDPTVLLEYAPQLADEATRALRGRVHVDRRTPHDDQLGQENVS